MTFVAPAPSWRMWLMWGIGVFGYVLAITNRTSLAAVGVDASHRFDADASTLSMFAVLQLAVYGFMQLPVGLWLDRWGARPIMAIGMVLMAAGQIVMALSPNVGIAIAARMLLGAGDAAIFPGVLRLVATWFPAQRSSLMMQLTGITGQLGQVVALVPLPLLLHATSWQVAFGGLAGLAIVFAVLIAAFVRNHPPQLPADVSVNTDTGAITVVTSAVDTRQGIRAAWSHPGTRLAFWTHFTAPFAGTAFVMLWGVPFLTAGEGLTTAQASAVTSVYVVAGIVLGPVVGALSARHPHRRSRMLVLPAVGAQLVAWVAVLLWPSPVPAWLLVLLVIALASGGPASMVAFDFARAHNPAHRLSTATGVTNVGGFLAGLTAILLIGVALDVQGASRPELYTDTAFRWAFATQIPLWLLGCTMILRERARTRRML
ncbi:MFS transporter [Microbacterium marinilacus]|uniref:MFS transporter n=1 Tax=Microbacterium marinilacus TaxID=415209 RepID=A0ABP7B5G7_9MICO|nr:MFS transporter [Microbacterium marinilacus]MBY0687768.1 MFS transporter [Microbacterium marinilacus]